MPGEELFIDYLLDAKGRRTAAVKKAACLSMWRAALPRIDVRPTVSRTGFSGDRRALSSSKTQPP